MKRWMVVAAAVAVLLLAGLPVLAVTLSGSDQDTGPGDRAGHGQGWRQHHMGGTGRHMGVPGRHMGPVPGWSHLTEAQRARRMAALAQRHADAMRSWARCVAAGRDDCTRPLPPRLGRRG